MCGIERGDDTYDLGGAIGLYTEAFYEHSGTLIEKWQRVAVRHGHDAISDYSAAAEQSCPFLIKYNNTTTPELSAYSRTRTLLPNMLLHVEHNLYVCLVACLLLSLCHDGGPPSPKPLIPIYP